MTKPKFQFHLKAFVAMVFSALGIFGYCQSVRIQEQSVRIRELEEEARAAREREQLAGRWMRKALEDQIELNSEKEKELQRIRTAIH